MFLHSVVVDGLNCCEVGVDITGDIWCTAKGSSSLLLKSCWEGESTSGAAVLRATFKNVQLHN